MAKKASKASARKAARKPARSAARTPAKAVPKASGGSRAKVARASRKDQYLEVFLREHATTMKVLRALPAGQSSFAPHPRSMTALRLVSTLAGEQGIVRAALEGTLKMPPEFSPPPPTWDDAIASYERGVQSVVVAVRAVSDARFDATVPFFVGPGRIGNVPVGELLWLMLMDLIHHRGQFSVYVRMAGGKVPSIYGPSADEPWN